MVKIKYNKYILVFTLSILVMFLKLCHRNSNQETCVYIYGGVKKHLC